MSGTALGQGNLVSTINRDGYWKLFAGADVDGEPLNFRSANPFDMEVTKVDPVTEDVYDARWLSKPASGGAVRIRAENDPEVGGFDFAAGPLGDIESVTITGETVETSQADGDGDALLWVGTYMDTQDTGDFFEWERLHGNTEAFAGFGDDTECLTHIPVDEDGFTIDREFEWNFVIVPIDDAPGWVQDIDPFAEPPVDGNWLRFPAAAMYPADPDEGVAGVTWNDYLDGSLTIDDPVKEETDVISLDTGPDTEIALPINLRGVFGANEEAIIDDVVVDYE